MHRQRPRLRWNYLLGTKAQEKPMNKTDTDFDRWFETLRVNVLARTGVNFRDRDSVMADYEDGKNVYDVIDDICAEYAD